MRKLNKLWEMLSHTNEWQGVKIATKEIVYDLDMWAWRVDLFESLWAGKESYYNDCLITAVESNNEYVEVYWYKKFISKVLDILEIPYSIYYDGAETILRLEGI